MDVEQLKCALSSASLIKRAGRVRQFFGLIIEADGPDVFLGERCEIHNGDDREPLLAEVVGIRNDRVLLMPYGHLRGIRKGSEIIATGEGVKVPVGEALLGRVIDPFGKPLDGREEISPASFYDILAEPVNPLTRPPISTKLHTGIRVIDSLTTLGRGQRLGIFAGSGVGKSTLLGMIARNMDAEVNVIALIGERGREVAEFISQSLGEEGMRRSVVVVATSDQSALFRSHAALAASAIAEYFRDCGKQVMLTMDSVTRFAMAQREIGLSVGEPPTARGYTPSVFALLPKMLERAGTSASGGSITAIYTVLVEGDNMNDPIADSVRSIVDGHIVLDRKLAERGHFPAIEPLESNSRLARQLRSDEENKLAKELQALIAEYKRSSDLIELGAYKQGTNPLLDKAVRTVADTNRFLQQAESECSMREQTWASLQQILRS